MPHYTLIEYKLRRYVYLGHEHSMYVPPSIRNSFWAQNHHDDIMGVQIIGKIVKKNKPEEINSIVPIILKIKEEGILHDDRHLIFALAVCARFSLEQCCQMVTAAYKALPTICTDGLKLLMFVKFCNDAKTILHEKGYLSERKQFGYGNGFRNAMKKWYLDRDPLVSAELIVRNNRFENWTHKDIMKLIHIHSNDQSRQIFIIHTMCGMEKVEEMFGSKLKDIQIENDDEIFENKQLKFIYNFFKQIENLKKMDENTLRNEIELSRWGHIPEVIPEKMIQSPKILTSLVMHMPLRTLLDNTFFFAKKRLFHNSTPDVGLWEFILRFNNTVELKKSKIHPIESFLEYIKYSRNNLNIIRWQHNFLKENANNVLPGNKFKMYLMKNNEGDTSQPPEKKGDASQSTVNNKRKLTKEKQSHCKSKCFKQSEQYLKYVFDINPAIVERSKSKLKSEQKKENVKSKPKDNKTSQMSMNAEIPEFNEKVAVQDTLSETDVKLEIQNNLPGTCNLLSSLSINTQQTNAVPDVTAVINDNMPVNLIMTKPPPKIVKELTKFLSEDLIKKTLENLKSSDRNIIIAYDRRQFTQKKMCEGTSLLSVQEAIILIAMSLIYPEKSKKRPTLIGLQEPSKSFSNKVEVDYKQDINFANLKSDLFKEQDHDSSLKAEKVEPIYPVSVLNWARESKKDFDVFVFLGTNNMNFTGLKDAKKNYKEAFKKTPKIITCCLNGKHSEQSHLSRDNMLFIAGFDKKVGNIIASFINEEF